MSQRRPDRRKSQLAAIHAAKRDLAMDEDSYRQMLWTVARVRSASDLDDAGRQRVLDHMRNVGAQRKPRRRVAQHPGRPHTMDAGKHADLLAKIEAQLADMKLSWNYANAIAKRQCGIDRVAWLKTVDQLQGVIAALGYEQEKRSKIAAIDRVSEHLATDRLGVLTQVGIDVDSLPKNWHRNLRVLGVVCKVVADAGYWEVMKGEELAANDTDHEAKE